MSCPMFLTCSVSLENCTEFLRMKKLIYCQFYLLSFLIFRNNFKKNKIENEIWLSSIEMN